MGYEAHFITLVATIDATIDTFNQTAYAHNLASLAEGVAPEDIELRVTAGSLVVEAIIKTTTKSIAEAVQATLASTSLANLTAALGVPVQGIQPPTLVSQLVLAPAMPPLQR